MKFILTISKLSIKIANSYHNDIYLVEEKRTKILYTAKVLQECFIINPESIDISNSVQQLKYPTIIKFIGFSKHDFDKNYHFTTIWEYVKGPSLRDIISNKDFKMPQNYKNNTTKQIILAGVANGMKHLHESNLIHKYLNSSNVLLDETFHPLISDACMTKTMNPSYMGTEDYELYEKMTYFAPEILKEEPIGFKADVFSFGIVMYEVITNSRAYGNKLISTNTIFQIANKDLRPDFKTN